MGAVDGLALFQAQEAEFMIDAVIGVRKIGAVAPGLDADQLGSRLGPDEQHGMIGIRNMDLPSAALERHAPALERAENEGVDGEIFILQGQHFGVFGDELSFVIIQRPFQQGMDQGFFFVKMQFIIFKAFGGAIGFMGADAEIEGALVPAGYVKGDLDLIAFHRIGDPEIVFKGEAFLLFIIQQGHKIFARFFHLEGSVPCKAVLIHGIAHAVQLIAIIPKCARYGEKNGRMAAPDGRIALPDEFLARIVLYRMNFSADGRNKRSQLFAFDGDQFHNG